MSKTVYEHVREFKQRHRGGISWRIKKNSEVIQKYLNPGEEVLYAFAGQKNESVADIFQTAVFALTNKRLLIGQKRVVFGHFYTTVTPDMFNDLTVYQGIIWGKITIDTVKEIVYVSNLPKSALDEIETNITEYMMREKKKYRERDTKE